MRPARAVGPIILALVVVFGSAAFAQTASEKPAAQSSAQVNLEMKDVPVKEAIDTLFQGTGHKYRLEPGVEGTILELKLKGITFEEALAALGDAAKFTYTIEDGVYVIRPKAAATVTVQKEQASPEASATQQAPESAASATEGAGSEPPPESPAPGTQVIINQPPGPIYYGHPPVECYPPVGYYGYPNVMRFGNVSVISTLPPIVIGPFGRVFTPARLIPPIPGWVSPEALRFLRNEYIISPRPGFIY